MSRRPRREIPPRRNEKSYEHSDRILSARSTSPLASEELSREAQSRRVLSRARSDLQSALRWAYDRDVSSALDPEHLRTLADLRTRIINGGTKSLSLSVPELLEEFGLTPAGVRQHFHDYCARFEIQSGRRT